MASSQQALLAVSGLVLTGLDSYSTGVKAVRALKRKWTGYSGQCIRIRRSSDSTEQDIGFVSSAIDAAVDSAAAVSFAGAGDAFVTTIYDQSGNGDNWVQATSGKQPLVVNSGVYDGFVRFDGSSQSMESTNNSGAVAIYNLALLIMQRSGAVGQIFFERGVSLGGNSNNESALSIGTVAGSAQVIVYKSEGTNYFGATFLNSTRAPNGTDANWAAFEYPDADAAGAEFWKGSTKYTNDNTTSVGTVGTGVIGTASKWYLAARNNASFYADINWFADAVYEGAVSDVDKAAIQAILQR